MAGSRLASGGRIDRSRPLSFTFDGRRMTGYAGDTLASALLANGVEIVSRSFKYHRPRGIVGVGAEEPNAILQLGTGAATLPHQRATQVELYDGLVATAPKGWPNVRFDLGAVNDAMSRVFGAGFYYKTFMFPASAWEHYESVIRRTAGLGYAPDGPDPDVYAHRNAHCDVLVVGAGPAGLAAAQAAARSGARVIVADEQNEFGGSALGSCASVDGQDAADWAAGVAAELDAAENVTCLRRTTVFAYHDQNFLTAVERCTDHLPANRRGGVRQRQWRIRAREVILAQGAFERPLVFCNNDRPGVMQASAVSTYIRRYGVLPGRHAVVFTNNDSAYQSALDLKAAGAGSVIVIDSRQGGGGSLAARAVAAGITIRKGRIVTNARGRRSVSAVEIARWTGKPDGVTTDPQVLHCDLVAMSGGFSPAVHLHSHAGGRNCWDNERLCFVPGETMQAGRCIGAGNGTFAPRDALAEAVAAGLTAAEHTGHAPASVEVPDTDEARETPIEALWRVPADRDPDRCPKQFVDFQTDTSVADIRLAVREGYTSVEHVKRYTAMGFGTDQGKLGNINGMAVLAECLGKPIPEVGTTTFRPAYTPVTFGACAGEEIGALYDPVRKTAIHEAHVAAGAPMEVVGQWHRPWYFPTGDEDIEAAVRRECLAVRGSVGMMDASTLGKIDVQGPDATEFLERIYTHDIAKMKIGRCAYGILLGEDGMIKDDGVMARLGDQHYYLTTTTGGAAAVLAWLELWLQTEWPDLDVFLTSVTDRYSTIAVAGPNSRNVLEKLDPSIDLSREAFPFMAVRDAMLNGVPVQLFRVSFSGELAFEVNVDGNDALAMWHAIAAAGAEYGITPYGTESMHVLRAEKGFVIVGQDTDGSMTPVDMRMNWLLSKTKDFLGKRSLARSDSARRNRKQFVGLTSVDGETVITEGAQLVADADAPKPVSMQGHVTSGYFSACLGHPIALGLIEGGAKRNGETVVAVDARGKTVPVTICSPVFYDPKSERQRD